MSPTSQNDEKKTTPPLPYVPPQVALSKPFPEIDANKVADIEAKLHDANDPEVSAYRKTRLDGNVYGRYSKKLFGTSHGIIYGKMGLYAIYNEDEKQKEIVESGKFGKVKLAKNLYSDEWLILKTQLLEIPTKKNTLNETLTKIYQNEHDILNSLKLSNEPTMIRRSSKNTKLLKGSLLMKYAKGNDLFIPLNNKINEKHPMHKWPDLFWLHLCIRITEALINDVARHDILHCDIKFENFVYDINDDTAHVIDFGNAKKKVHSSVKPTNFSLNGFNAPENFTSQYTEKSEVYALSNIFEGFLYNKIPKTYLENEKPIIQFNPPQFTKVGSNTKFAKNKELTAFVANMRNDSADKRPTLEETLDFLKTKYDQYRKNKVFTKDFEQIDKIFLNAREQETTRLKTIYNHANKIKM